MQQNIFTYIKQGTLTDEGTKKGWKLYWGVQDAAGSEWSGRGWMESNYLSLWRIFLRILVLQWQLHGKKMILQDKDTLPCGTYFDRDIGVLEELFYRWYCLKPIINNRKSVEKKIIKRWYSDRRNQPQGMSSKLIQQMGWYSIKMRQMRWLTGGVLIGSLLAKRLLKEDTGQERKWMGYWNPANINLGYRYSFCFLCFHSLQTRIWRETYNILFRAFNDVKPLPIFTVWICWRMRGVPLAVNCEGKGCGSG